MWKLLCLCTVAYEQLTRAECKQSLWEWVCIGRNIYQAIETWLEIKLCKSSQVVEKVLDEKNVSVQEGRSHRSRHFLPFCPLSTGIRRPGGPLGSYAFITLLNDVQLNNII